MTEGYRVIHFVTEHEMSEVALAPWPEGDNRGEAWRAASGFEAYSAMQLGHFENTELWVAYYRAQPNAPWHAMVEVREGDHYDTFVVADMIALFRLRMYLRPFFAHRQRDQLDDLCSTVQRAFEAWHGHPSYEPCHECDRDEMAREEMRERARAKRAAAVKP